jgi:hypothetical protein
MRETASTGIQKPSVSILIPTFNAERWVIGSVNKWVRVD